jgi:hypothetical protein
MNVEKKEEYMSLRPSLDSVEAKSIIIHLGILERRVFSRCLEAILDDAKKYARIGGGRELMAR